MWGGGTTLIQHCLISFICCLYSLRVLQLSSDVHRGRVQKSRTPAILALRFVILCVGEFLNIYDQIRFDEYTKSRLLSWGGGGVEGAVGTKGKVALHERDSRHLLLVCPGCRVTELSGTALNLGVYHSTPNTILLHQMSFSSQAQGNFPPNERKDNFTFNTFFMDSKENIEQIKT